jgi:hypothetical protein
MPLSSISPILPVIALMPVKMFSQRKCYLALMAVLLLSSCDPFTSPESLMDEYLTRLSRVLDVTADNTSKITPAKWPRIRDRRIEVPQMDINMLEFLGLYGCDLQVVVGERNAILGKVMQPLNRLRYSLQFIVEAEACLSVTDDDALKQTLIKAREQKRQQLPAVIWQAGWASEEMAHLFSHTAKPITIAKPLSDSQQLAEDFSYLMQTVEALSSKPDDLSLARWGDIQQRWQYQHDMGALIKTAQQLTQMLNAGSNLIAQRLADNPICYQGKPNQDAKRLEGVFFKAYIGHVQPYIALLSQHRDALLPAARAFALQQADMAPAAVKTYWQQYLLDTPESIWPAFDRAIKSHTQHWQDLLEQCGMRPKSAPVNSSIQ